ncbi:hypothetical protein [Streptomyces sp. NBC_00503]|uniref:hypothetical protein n=1 Tax=Streptomyces sp. NBC_00503 TaxID=2903659 RepID=UPI002E814956|nr:hypothetical protein [Streptomyces sp. NBC_00503]WUD81900.1 hypothetical protein OG490_15890 [Streptomyces sp. NBC_00503]
MTNTIDWTGWWESLPEGIRRQVDGYVLQDRRMYAVRTVWQAGRAHGLGLNEAQELVHTRYEALGDRVALTPDSPLDLESLAARASGAPGRVAAIEAVWDGDTVHDWFVLLLAVTEDPPTDYELATVYWRTGLRALEDSEADAGALDPHAAAATRAGTALAEHLGVPFHFASPGTPDDEAPRWRDGAGGPDRPATP